MTASATPPWMTPGLRQIDDDILCAAVTPGNVLLSGEPGTGRKSIAELIHRKSAQRTGPFVVGTRDDLPGCGRGTHGSRVLQAARNGSFLMEDLDSVVDARDEARLLRFVDCGRDSSHVRFMVAASNALPKRVRSGQFSENLFYRLNVIHVVIPPLRERPEDICVLLRHFMAAWGVGEIEVSAAAWDVLRAYSWPGNLRELRSLAEALAGRDGRRPIEISDLPAGIVSAQL